MRMEQAEKERLQRSIQNAKKAISEGLVLDPEAKSQLYRMIDYYEDKLKEDT